MAILSKLIGDEVRANNDKVQKELDDLLIDQEVVELAYKEFRDESVFTNYRIILIDKKGMTGVKTIYHSIPYNSIIHFKIESSGVAGHDHVIYLYVYGEKDPIKIDISRGSKNLDLSQMVLASHTCGLSIYEMKEPAILSSQK